MRNIFILLAFIVTLGCVTVDPAIQEGNQMAAEAVVTALENTGSFIDAWADECIGLVERDYETKRAHARATLLAEGTNGMVDLATWTEVNESYDIEIAKARDYYRSRAATMKTMIGEQLETALMLMDLNAKALAATGISDEDFGHLLDTTFALGNTIIEQSDIRDARDEAESAASREAELIKWREIVQRIRDRVEQQQTTQE